ncbi:hypothetical protein [Phytohabitans kaempferiae]|uniref:Uncharacterized protein n=1 Tax=Phytohabitans kaempferiae TaxID=1620943 RepID=A0ABV6M504_9ACTN
MRNVGREVSGAWRSLRYDLSRRSARPAAADDAPTQLIYPAYEPAHRPRRRLMAATTFGVLSLVGAAGTYFAVVNGLSALASEEDAPPDRLPAVVGTTSPSPTARGVAPVPSPSASRSTAPPPTTPKPSPTGREGIGRATATPTPSPTCACVTPPVPKPTSPPPITKTPDPSPTSADPDPTGTSSPDPTPGPSDPPTAGG